MKEKNSSIIPDELVINKIYYIREQNVMLDSDLAELYGVETKVLNQAISRNFERFPSDFMPA
ncbi:MAG TPA: ORF6N domain-containing protein [Daejeonella sp.]|uniref:ORF6N domain-containing protein n=1 Tax=Daejeonella sp. TaxID=2805397 RepID=UPI002EDBAB6C